MSESRIVFYVGFDTELTHQFDRHYYADKMLAENFGGSTRVESRGSWIGPNGLETEPSMRFEVLASGLDLESRAQAAAESLRRLYRQVEVIYSIEPIEIRRARETENLVRSSEGHLTLGGPKQ